MSKTETETVYFKRPSPVRTPRVAIPKIVLQRDIFKMLEELKDMEELDQYTLPVYMVKSLLNTVEMYQERNIRSGENHSKLMFNIQNRLTKEKKYLWICAHCSAVELVEQPKDFGMPDLPAGWKQWCCPDCISKESKDG